MLKKTKAIYKLEEKMQDVEAGSLRYQILDCAKNFKSAWIELGQYLVSVYKDKLFKEWGHSTFEYYCMKELGVRKETAIKLLRSYYFLEKEEPDLLKEDFLEQRDAKYVPPLEAINTLRLAKGNKNLKADDYLKLKKQVFEEGRNEQEVKQSFRSLLESLKEDAPEEARQKRKMTTLRRMVGVLSSLKEEGRINKLLSAGLLDSLDKIITKIEQEMS